MPKITHLELPRIELSLLSLSLWCYLLRKFVKNISRAQRAYWQPDILAYTLVSSSAAFYCEHQTVDVADGRNIPLVMKFPSSLHNWHANIMNMRGSQKAKSYCHEYQSLIGHSSWTVPSLDRLPDSIHPFEDEESTVRGLHKERLCERGRVNSWKKGPGRKKDWRSVRYLTCKRRQKGVEFPVASWECVSKSAPKAAGVYLLTKKAPWQIAVPRSMLMQRSSSDYGSPSSPKPRSSMQIVANLGHKLKHTQKSQIWDKSEFLPQDFPVLFGPEGIENDFIDDRGPPR